ncbi:unnamed protein product, partial [Allacma fusca]
KKQWKCIRDQWLAYKRKLTTKSGQASGRIPFFRHERSMRVCEDPSETESLNGTISNVDNSAVPPSPASLSDSDEATINENEDGQVASIPTVTITSVQSSAVTPPQVHFMHKNLKVQSAS